MRFDTKWGRKACSPVKRVVRNTMVWTSSIASVLSLIALVGWFAYESPLAAAVVFGFLVAYSLASVFLAWITDDGCEEERPKKGREFIEHDPRV